MKKTFAAFAACFLTLGFSTSTARAGFLDDWAHSAMYNAFNYALAAYQEKPSSDILNELYYDYYAVYYLYYGGILDDDTFRYYGYVCAFAGYNFAASEQNKNPDLNTEFGKNTYAAFYYSYFGYNFAYSAWVSPFNF